MISCYWSLYFEEEFLFGFFGLSSLSVWASALQEKNLCDHDIYSSKKKKFFKNVLLWHYLPRRRQQLNLHSVRELRSQALSYDPQPFPEQSEEQKVIFFSIPFTWMTGCRQPSTDLGLCGEIAGQPGAPFVFSPSSCLHSYTFKWAMHAWLRSSRKATWYEWGFLSPFFPAWRNLNERSSFLLWDKMCLVVLQDYLWSECQQET